MNQLEELQAIFLKWFKHHSDCTLDTIEKNIKNLCASYEFEGNGKYLIFFPLVRKGFIEFIGEDRYQVAPSIIFHHLQSSISTGINLSEEQAKQISSTITFATTDQFGVIRFSSTATQTENICKELSCIFSMPNTSHILSNFPKLSETMMNEAASGFTKNVTLDGSGYYQNLNNHKFDESKKNGNVGIFKTEKDAHKYFFHDGTDCYEIPSKKYNPEGRYIAETIQAVRISFDFLVYNERAEQLMANGINIPILIDRVLRLPSIHLADGVTNEKFKTTYTNISPSVIKQLNRIFETKIKTIHE